MSSPPDSSSEPPSLPVELLVIMGEFLLGDLCFGALANLNATCRTVHQETLPVLYETAIWQYKRDLRVKVPSTPEEREKCHKDYWKYVKYLMIEQVLEKPRFPLKHFQYRDFFPNIKCVLTKPATPEKETEWYNGGPDIWFNCSLIVYEPVRYATLSKVVQSSIPACTFYSNPEIRSEPILKQKRQRGGYIPGRIGSLRMNRNAALLYDEDDAADETDYGYLFRRLGLHLSVGFGPDDSEASNNLQGLFLMGYNTANRANQSSTRVTCRSALLPTVMKAVAMVVGFGDDLYINLKDPLSMPDFLQLLDHSVDDYLKSRRIFYDPLTEEDKEEILSQLDHDESLDWLSLNLHGICPDLEPMMRIHPKINDRSGDADSQSGSSSSDSSSSSSSFSFSSSSEEDGDEDDKDSFEVMVYNANVRPSTLSKGQANLFVDIRQWPAGGNLDPEIISRKFHAETL